MILRRSALLEDVHAESRIPHNTGTKPSHKRSLSANIQYLRCLTRLGLKFVIVLLNGIQALEAVDWEFWLVYGFPCWLCGDGSVGICDLSLDNFVVFDDSVSLSAWYEILTARIIVNDVFNLRRVVLGQF